MFQKLLRSGKLLNATIKTVSRNLPQLCKQTNTNVADLRFCRKYEVDLKKLGQCLEEKCCWQNVVQDQTSQVELGLQQVLLIQVKQQKVSSKNKK
jgi:hypothetical protein